MFTKNYPFFIPYFQNAFLVQEVGTNVARLYTKRINNAIQNYKRMIYLVYMTRQIEKKKERRIHSSNFRKKSKIIV